MYPHSQLKNTQLLYLITTQTYHKTKVGRDNVKHLMLQYMTNSTTQHHHPNQSNYLSQMRYPKLMNNSHATIQKWKQLILGQESKVKNTYQSPESAIATKTPCNFKKIWLKKAFPFSRCRLGFGWVWKKGVVRMSDNGVMRSEYERANKREMSDFC